MLLLILKRGRSADASRQRGGNSPAPFPPGRVSPFPSPRAARCFPRSAPSSSGVRLIACFSRLSSITCWTFLCITESCRMISMTRRISGFSVFSMIPVHAATLPSSISCHLRSVEASSARSCRRFRFLLKRLTHDDSFSTDFLSMPVPLLLPTPSNREPRLPCAEA